MSDADRADTDNLGFLLAKASQHWNDLLAQGFTERGFPEVRPSYGSVLVPQFEDSASWTPRRSPRSASGNETRSPKR